MRLDLANRSFLASMLLALALGAFVLCGALGGVLVPLVLAPASHGAFGRWPHDGAAVSSLLLFACLVVLSVGLAVRALALQLLASSRLARRIGALRVTAGALLTRVAAASGLDGRVVVVDAPASFSFVYGLLTPRVAVSRGLLEATTPQELRAVLEHERYHVCNLDPLKIVLLRALAQGLFFLPALDWLRGRYLAGRELAADRRAVAVCGRRTLAAALLKALRGPDWGELPLAAAAGEQEVLYARLAQLETGAEPRGAALDVRVLVRSLLGVAMLLGVFLASVSAVGGPQAVQRATGSGLAAATLLGSLACTAPYASALLLAFSLLALRARRPLPYSPSVEHAALRSQGPVR